MSPSRQACLSPEALDAVTAAVDLWFAAVCDDDHDFADELPLLWLPTDADCDGDA